jgi:hypothetical protein
MTRLGIYQFSEQHCQLSYRCLPDLVLPEGIEMRKYLLAIAVTIPLISLPVISSAHGCIKGAAVGGVVGHVAGHHAVVGAAAGCVIGHHRAKVKDKEAAQAAAHSQIRPTGSTSVPPNQ